ncbi:hypothetical protein B296_00001420 [Ensete ventricosum]|uniref:Uncharacterized protein n=1 Tax=Ensete ventricosum TaxID=4639 RepID=A0A426YME1_ENSVE|nr:hypothetical protein B296_00001420 [Ensete ventricosum]
MAALHGLPTSASNYRKSWASRGLLAYTGGPATLHRGGGPPALAIVHKRPGLLPRATLAAGSVNRCVGSLATMRQQCSSTTRSASPHSQAKEEEKNSKEKWEASLALLLL